MLFRKEAITGTKGGPIHRIDLVVISDRGPNATKPLRAFVNSLLNHTTLPISLNIVTTESKLPWLSILNVSNYFSVHYHDPEKALLNRTKQLLADTNYYSGHYSALHSSMRLFLPSLDYPLGTANKVLMLDDDIVFYQDIAPLVHHMMQRPNQLSLACHIDPRRVHVYWTKRNRTRNGHTTRFCLGGWMGFPRGERTVKALTDSLWRVVQEYPTLDTFGWSAADQDVMNRYLKDHYPAECDDDDDEGNITNDLNCGAVDLIPCDWTCDFNSCGYGSPIAPQPKCHNCPNITRCKAYHFLRSAYHGNIKVKKWKPRSWRWGYYDQMVPMEQLQLYDDRVRIRLNETGLEQ